MSITIDRETISKFDVAGPRYTSYPTAPNWTEDVNEDVYTEKLRQFGQSGKTLSLYIHIPFCQTLCSFCACNVLIRKQEDKYGDDYLNHLFKEIELVSKNIGKKVSVKQFHWGGGTPTYLNEDQIKRLFHKCQEHFDVDLDGEVAIEIDPRTIDKHKVQLLRNLGFNRISMGVQDFDEKVQEDVNRIQPYSMVKEFNDWCRELKFHSVNFDLIYGLPDQTPKSFHDTIDKVIGLRPDRIALYSFAYVPWLKKHQSKIEKDQMPDRNKKLDIFLNSRQQFLDSDYKAIAMDHFALKDDELAQSFEKGVLYRNFMGYTVKPADEYLGLGLTSIGFLEDTFIQNHKVLKDYYDALDQGCLPAERGKELTLDDKIRQWTINSLMCQFEVDRGRFQEFFHDTFDQYFEFEGEHIYRCKEDGLLKEENQVIRATDLGKIFIRNVCMGFDKYLQQQTSPRKFSQTV